MILFLVSLCTEVVYILVLYKMSVPESFKKKQARNEALAKAAATAAATAAKVIFVIKLLMYLVFINLLCYVNIQEEAERQKEIFAKAEKYAAEYEQVNEFFYSYAANAQDVFSRCFLCVA